MLFIQSYRPKKEKQLLGISGKLYFVDFYFMDIYIMAIDGSGIVNITNDEIEDYSPSWSPDGNWISFTSGNASNYDIWKMNIHTKQKMRLTTQPKRDETPYYKPK